MWKDFKHLCLASTTISGEGIYAEYTYNGDKQELYIIYFELLRRGYDVAIGKIDNQEVDFIATKTDEKKYVQVTESMNSPKTSSFRGFFLFIRIICINYRLNLFHQSIIVILVINSTEHRITHNITVSVN